MMRHKRGFVRSFLKASTPEQQALERALANQEGTVRAAFDTFLKSSHRALTLERLRELIEAGRVDEALGIVNQYIIQMGEVFPKVFEEVGTAQVGILARASRSAIGVGFDPGDRVAAELMRTNTLEFVTNFTEQQRATTRTALAHALDVGQGSLAAARSFRDSIGLTQPQQNAVWSYAQALERNTVDSLSRAMRDRRFDATVERATSGGKPLTNTQIGRMVDRYRERMLTLRAETIARTETLKVVNQAHHEALHQVIEQTGMDPNRVQRVWHATRDKRTRDSHAAMDGQSVALDQAFLSGLGNKLMFPGDPNAPPEDFINCRCVVTTRIN